MQPRPTLHQSKRVPWNLAIVGGGRACQFFLELIKTQSFPLLNINLVGVCDIDPNATGLQMARKMGVYTTDNFRDFYKIPDLDGIIELTNDRQVLLELIQQRPKKVGILEHNIGKLIRSLFTMNLQLKDAQHQVILEKMSSDFLIQQSDAAIVVLKPDFTIAEANEAYLKIVNKTKSEVVGMACYETYYGLETPCSIAKPELQCPMLETLRTGKSAHVIHELPKTFNRPTYCNIVTYPLIDQDGQIIRIIETWRDISAEFNNRWEKRMAELKADLKKLVQEDRMISLGKLVASCVHEINNPLQGLLTFSHIIQESLSKGRLSPAEIKKLSDFAALMTEELERCGNIVSGLLSFSREMPVEYRDLDIHQVLDSVISLTRHKMELQNIRLAVSLCPEMVVIKGDKNLLQQCLLNLIFNAMEAMPAGGELHIRSVLIHQGTWVAVCVEDSGCGIPSKNKPHIFEPFFSTKPAGEGTGMGLSIVYGVVMNHRGKIEFESEPGKGTKFRLEFPMDSFTQTSTPVDGKSP